ncbi:hypothetical protein L8S00_06780 [Vibrio splendidus]|uniref:hypothetical protein n=1 Tax=Vibrio splendidus TaxID=29497 RepID=UPI002469A935|nr:hypothetical protein [Vibrio splendidus]MDH5903097.1 hypothetical protein [Vibrio splendidus]
MELIFTTLVALRWKYSFIIGIDVKAIHLNIEPKGRINTIVLESNDCHTSNGQEQDAKLAPLIAVIGTQLEPIFAQQHVNRKRFWGN